MNIDPYILAFSAATVFVTIWMGFWSAKKSRTAGDFFVAGRSVSVGWNASAISGEYLSAASFMGIAGMVMSSGYDALWYPVCYACGYLFLLLFIAGPLRRFGAYTIPDFAEGRFDSPLFRKIAVVFVLFIGFFYTMPQMKGAGTTLAYIFPGLPYWAGVFLVGAVITLNVALGGMKGITLVQAFQYWVKMFAISAPIFVLMAVYGHYGRQLGANGTGIQSNPIPGEVPMQPASEASQTSAGEANTPGTTAVPGAEYSGKYYEASAGPARLAVVDYGSNAVASVNVGAHSVDLPAAVAGVARDIVAGSPGRTNHAAIVRRSLPEAAPSDASWIAPFGPLTSRAAKAANLPPEEGRLYSLLYTYSLIIALVCGTAGLPHILVRFYTNPDGAAAKRTTMWVMILIGTFYVFPPVFGVFGRNLLPELYAGVGVKGTDKVVLELPRLLNDGYAPLGSILSGITCAGAFAAFMSTFSGLLVSMTGALAHDVYGRMLRPGATAAQRMRMFRVAAVLIGGVAVLLGCFVEPLEINFMVGQAFAIAAASYFPLLFMSVWWRRLTMKGAAAGMLAGGLAAMIAISATSFSSLSVAPGRTGELFAAFRPLNEFWAQHPMWRILCEQPAIWAVPLAIGLMIVVSRLTAREIPADIRMKMLVLHAPEKLGLKQEYIQEHQHG
ncbi:MAG TPA: cation acetate symporter [Verrucomicrobia bacterium]|nr:cation acetate symporter [Verrucomicrobiota bacterium]HOP97887.1 cation acetate symporter [Verrucomicrobiota bacterium]HPU56160.1 cation acetate symporter [Verrucomicrobiota bacterium]